MSYVPNTSTSLPVLSDDDRRKLRQTWQQSPAVWRFVPGRGCPTHQRKWLMKQSPADWHDIALKFDFESKDLSPLEFIARRPSADRASIMSIVLALDIGLHEHKLARPTPQHLHQCPPQISRLLDLIHDGFARGFYQSGRFTLRQPQTLLAQTKSDIATLERPLNWPLPDQAWRPLAGQAHRPDYIWDKTDQCQRLPFETWVRHKLRPN